MFSIMNKLKALYKRWKFCRVASIGVMTTFGPTSNCINKGGNITIGNKCDIHAIITVNKEARIVIKDNTTIRYNSKVGANVSIEIGSHCIISNNVTIYDNNNHPIDPKKRWELCESGWYSEKWGWEYSDSKPIVIEDNVWIGEGAVILKGVRIGKGSIVACHAVVTKNVEPFCIVAGNPATCVKRLV